jgi:hypothetical protein
MSNEKNIECYICGTTNASELPKLGPWCYIECHSCGNYKIHYDLISVLAGLDRFRKEKVIKKLIAIVKDKQDKEILRYGTIQYLLQDN